MIKLFLPKNIGSCYNKTHRIFNFVLLKWFKNLNLNKGHQVQNYGIVLWTETTTFIPRSMIGSLNITTYGNLVFWIYLVRKLFIFQSGFSCNSVLFTLYVLAVMTQNTSKCRKPCKIFFLPWINFCLLFSILCYISHRIFEFLIIF